MPKVCPLSAALTKAKLKLPVRPSIPSGSWVNERVPEVDLAHNHPSCWSPYPLVMKAPPGAISNVPGPL